MRKTWGQSIRKVFERVRGLLWSSLLLLLPALYLLVGLEKGRDLIWFNAWRGGWTDPLFLGATRIGEEYVYILLTAYFFFRRRKEVWWIPLTGIAVSIVSFLMKTYFRAPRPGRFAGESWYADELVLVEGVRPLTGMTSLPSGHTMSAFALAFMITYLIPLRRGAWIPVFVLAVLVGVSRMYLVLHFLPDVVLGMVIGLMVGFVLALWHQRVQSSGPAADPGSSS